MMDEDQTDMDAAPGDLAPAEDPGPALPGMLPARLEGIAVNGFGSVVAARAADRANRPRVRTLGVPDRLIDHATRGEQLEEVGLTAGGIAAAALEPVVALAGTLAGVNAVVGTIEGIGSTDTFNKRSRSDLDEWEFNRIRWLYIGADGFYGNVIPGIRYTLGS